MSAVCTCVTHVVKSLTVGRQGGVTNNATKRSDFVHFVSARYVHKHALPEVLVCFFNKKNCVFLPECDCKSYFRRYGFAPVGRLLPDGIL